MSKTCIVIGASHAAGQLVTSLRQEGWQGRILVIGDESELPYHRPPLSKSFLAGEKTAEEILIRPQATYEKADVEFLLNKRVTKIERDIKAITLDDGQQLFYDKLALCTGARVRVAPIPGAELSGVCYLRTLADVEKIKGHVTNGGNAVIVGGGYIGLETAAALNKQGMKVTVLEMASRILERVTCSQISDFYTRIHQEEGVDIKTTIQVSELVGSTKVESVTCANGTKIPADLVVIGIGIIPNTELAQEAGLEVDNGIVTDQYAQTNDPNIVACGDCANHPNELYNRRIRLESVPNATDQAKSAAASICGKPKAYSALPWFWSDQYDVKLQIVGLNQGYDQIVVRGDINHSRSFAIFYLKEEVIISVDCINRPKEFVFSKKLVANKSSISAKRLADESIQVKHLLEIE
ncbi:NAD(P)/FAD-dependent oxidoreductase [Paraglaciecola arctica]|uniref:NAD(P)/FAD-dependent oxidoreductase n=1 Tax=Paraglaciecola arctica TaxID=1128911 RepID=UPI001C06D6A9|nr:FAD-dependent oxidoreductase [Paraglaciecola arctica]MBU3002946.1 FAD-dependent oxidoreductase [Paraglaciecola arctica]